MNRTSPLLITIRSTEDGYYRWELRDGPDGAFEYAGYAPLLERCFEEVIRAQWVLCEHLTGEADPSATTLTANPPTDHAPACLHTPHGEVLTVQQDIPALGHESESADCF
jgi:hypothetical protein